MSKEPDEYQPSDWATFDLLNHVLEKGWQAGSVIGVGLVAPVTALRLRRIGSLKPERVLTAVGQSALLGFALSGVLGLGKIYGTPLDKEGIKERVYRLHYNEGQKRVDLFSFEGELAGLVSGVFAFRQHLATPGLSLGYRLLPVLGCMAVGSAIGVAAHVATYKGAEKGLRTGPENMLRELKD